MIPELGHFALAMAMAFCLAQMPSFRSGARSGCDASA